MGYLSRFANWVEGIGARGVNTPNDAFDTGNWEAVGSTTRSSTRVTKQNALTISGVYSAVRVLSEAIASLPVHIITESNGVIERVDHPLQMLVNKEPNNIQTSYTYKQMIMQQLLLWGNSYSLIDFGGASRRPQQLLPINPMSVECELRSDGIVWYTIQLENNREITVDQSNILHFRGLGNDIKGTSVIDLAKENLGLGKAAEEFGQTFFGNGANMNGVLETDKPLSEKAINNLRRSLDKTHRGVNQSNKMLILEEGLKFSNTSIPPDSAQFLETRKFSINDIARWFKVPPHMLGDLERATFSNIEQQDLNFVKHSILPYVINIEQELNRKLLREQEKDSTSFKMNLEGLLRGDIKTRSEAYKTFINNGIMSQNEARALENMNPFEGGDSRYMPLNLAPINEDGTNQPQEEEVTEEVIEPVEDNTEENEEDTI